MSTLRLTYSRDDDGTGELFASVEAEGFSGRGSAWFNSDDLSAFCSRLGDYPLQAERLPRLEGGYWKSAGAGLKETHLSVIVTPHDHSGSLRVIVTVAEPTYEGNAPGLSRRAHTWFLVGYNDLERFQAVLRNVLAGSANEAVLSSELGQT